MHTCTYVSTREISTHPALLAETQAQPGTVSTTQTLRAISPQPRTLCPKFLNSGLRHRDARPGRAAVWDWPVRALRRHFSGFRGRIDTGSLQFYQESYQLSRTFRYLPESSGFLRAFLGDSRGVLLGCSRVSFGLQRV